MPETWKWYCSVQTSGSWGFRWQDSRGVFGGRTVGDNLPANSQLNHTQDPKGKNIDKNKVYPNIKLGQEAWIHRCSNNSPSSSMGTTKIINLVDNIGSLRVKLERDGLREISDAVPSDEVAGNRYFESRYPWKLGKYIAGEG
ncbi:hypothetical protein ACFX2I_033444 [Malus domestica]